MKHPHGPLPLSCLTCRQRRKKCDRAHPVCSRCTVGGFECLGYERIASNSSSSSLSPLDITPAPRSASFKPKKVPRQTHATYTLEREPRLFTPSDEDITNELSRASNSCQTLDSGYSPSSQDSPQPRDGRNFHTTGAQPRSTDALFPVSLVTPDASGLPLPDPLSFRSNFSQDLIVLSSNSPIHRHGPLSGDVMNHLALPPRFYPDPVTSGSTVKFILSLYEPIFQLLAFKPLNNHGNAMQEIIIARIRVSPLTHWSMYLGARIFRTILQGGQESDLRVYNPWFERLDQLCITSSNDNVLDDLVGRLSGGIELSYLKFMTSNINAGYSLLRNVAPTFMKVAFADPTLWPRHPNSSGISLAHVFTSPIPDLARFVFMDTIACLAFGVPPLVEYDTSCSVSNIGPIYAQRVEAKHASGATFITTILKISISRAYNHSPPVRHSWEEIEAEIRSWEPQPDECSPDDSWKSVARLAVKEGWRHAGLIYLYMGMCGVTSHDPRVQSSTRQIMSLLDITRVEDSFGIHFIFPRLLAGICVRGEKQRARIRESMTQSKNTATWLFRGMDVMPILDHLWHGVAANGGAVTWEDYVTSRRKTIHID